MTQSLVFIMFDFSKKVLNVFLFWLIENVFLLTSRQHFHLSVSSDLVIHSIIFSLLF